MAVETDTRGGTPHELRPTFRGRLHQLACIVAVPAGVALIVAADGAAATAAASVYVATLLVAFGISYAYHRLARAPRARRIMQRFDHAAIFLLITGTYVPLCIVGLPPAAGIPLLVVVATGAVAGVVIKLVAFDRLGVVGHVLYPALGWAAIAVAPIMVAHLSVWQIALIVAGGVTYTVGIPVLFARRPDPFPRHFGYHEVWHGFTVVAAGFHFAAVAGLVA